MPIDGTLWLNNPVQSSFPPLRVFKVIQQLLEQDFALVKSLGVRGFPTIIMVNEGNKGVKIVGQRSLGFYVKGLQQVLETAEPLQSQSLPTLKTLLEEEQLLFASEIEDMYDIKQNEVKPFLQE
jgi:putative protein-disulfide isomerase